MKQAEVMLKDGTPATLAIAKLKDTKFLAALMKGTGVTSSTDDKCMWFLLMVRGRLIGACCAKEMGKNKYRLKSDIVAPEWRKKGAYFLLSSARMEYVIKQGAVELTAYSSQYSRKQFLNDGFVEQGTEKKGTIYMRKTLE